MQQAGNGGGTGMGSVRGAAGRGGAGDAGGRGAGVGARRAWLHV